MSGCPAGLSGMVRSSGGPLAGMRRMGGVARAERALPPGCHTAHSIVPSWCIERGRAEIKTVESVSYGYVEARYTVTANHAGRTPGGGERRASRRARPRPGESGAVERAGDPAPVAASRRPAKGSSCAERSPRPPSARTPAGRTLGPEARYGHRRRRARRRPALVGGVRRGARRGWRPRAGGRRARRRGGGAPQTLAGHRRTAAFGAADLAAVRGRTPGLPPRGVRPRLAASANAAPFARPVALHCGKPVWSWRRGTRGGGRRGGPRSAERGASASPPGALGVAGGSPVGLTVSSHERSRCAAAFGPAPRSRRRRRRMWRSRMRSGPGTFEAEVYGSADVTYDPQDSDRRVGRGAGRNRDGRLDGAGAGTCRQQSGSPAIVRAERSAALS